MAELIYPPVAKVELHEAAVWSEECQENLGWALLVESGGIYVVAVMPLHRRPGCWRSQMPG